MLERLDFEFSQGEAWILSGAYK